MARSKLSADQYKALRDLGRTMTGYDSTSPIWGMTDPDVITAIEGHINIGTYSSALELLGELKKRKAAKAYLAVGKK